MTKYIAYYRVSTKRQGGSGLGLDAQKEQIADYVRRNGGVITAEFTEIKSGTSRKRDMIRQAVEMSNKEKATIIVAKLDRLARDAEYAHYIRNTAHDIVALDIPGMNKMIFGFFAAYAEYERDKISERTRDALGSLKRKGILLGKPRAFGPDEYMQGAVATARRHWSDKKDAAHRVAREFLSAGMSESQVASKLTDMGFGDYDSRKVKRLFISHKLITQKNDHPAS